MYAADIELEHRKPDGQKYKTHGNGKSFTAGMEKPFANAK